MASAASAKTIKQRGSSGIWATISARGAGISIGMAARMAWQQRAA